MAILCEICQHPADPARTFVVWEQLAPEPVSVLIGYCSEPCEGSDDSIWAPEFCERCQRSIRKHVPHIDARDPASRNFCLDPSGTPVCRECTGTLLSLDPPLSPTASLPTGWLWLE